MCRASVEASGGWRSWKLGRWMINTRIEWGTSCLKQPANGQNIKYSHPQIDGKVNPYKSDGDLLFHLFWDDYICWWTLWGLRLYRNWHQGSHDKNDWCVRSPHIIDNPKDQQLWIYRDLPKNGETNPQVHCETSGVITSQHINIIQYIIYTHAIMHIIIHKYIHKYKYRHT